MATLLLRLAAPMQSWGMDSKFETRRTNREPTKSGVIGLLAAALGLRREEAEAMRQLNQLHFGVRIDQEGSLLVDYHIARRVKPSARASDDKETSYCTWRHYLTDAVFLVGLESGDAAFLERLAAAVQAPAFPLFLGRRSCPPTLPLCLGIRPAGLEEALRREPALTPAWRKPQGSAIRFVLDADPDEAGAAVRRDVALSFNPAHRQFGFRAVKETVDSRPREAEEETRHDPFAEL